MLNNRMRSTRVDDVANLQKIPSLTRLYDVYFPRQTYPDDTIECDQDITDAELQIASDLVTKLRQSQGMSHHPFYLHKGADI